MAFFAPEKFAFICVLAGVLIDALLGVIRTVRTGGFLLSKLAQQTMFKITAYGAALVIVYLIERLAHDSGMLGIKLAAGWALACELWSISASVLIIWPDATFFRVLRKHLRGEIAAKLGEEAAAELDRAKPVDTPPN